MKKFFSTMLGAFVGTWLAFLIFGIVIFISGIIMMASMTFSNLSMPVAQLEDNSVLVLDLSGSIPERAYKANFQDLLGEEYTVPDNLKDILSAISIAKYDSRIMGIVVKCNGVGAGFATAKTIRDALVDFKNDGKWIYAYGESLAQGDYYISTAADSVFMNPVGMLDLHGVVSGIPFFKNTLEKIGVEMQIIRVGTFKSAVEPYMLTKMSDANRLQTQTYISNLWNNLTDSISASRGIGKDVINQYADSLGMFSPSKDAVKKGLIDGLCYGHEFESKVRNALGISKDTDIPTVSVKQLITTESKVDSSNKIAVLYASGAIVVSGDKNGINSADLVPKILDLAKDEEIKGLVLRVNSPGGSAYASEQIWEALEQFKKAGKPFAVSMGDYAASGGYYISCGADRIFAEPTTLTGSIGIYAMVPCMSGLLTDKLGVNFDFVTTNANTDVSTVKPLTEFQKASFQKNVNAGYELFTRRCATGRKMNIDKLKSIAEGRVWDGKEAKKIGLVDEFGNVADAVNWVALQAGIVGDYSVSDYPQVKEDFIDLLFSSMSESYYKINMQERFGNFYPLIEQVENLLNQDDLQCRMEYIEFK